MIPNVFTGQPHTAPGIIQHAPAAPTSDPGTMAASMQTQIQQQQQDQHQAMHGAQLYGDMMTPDAQQPVVAMPRVAPLWMKWAVVATVLGAIGVGSYFIFRR